MKLYAFPQATLEKAIARRMLSLPLSPRLTEGDVSDVIEAVLQVVKRCRR